MSAASRYDRKSFDRPPAAEGIPAPIGLQLTARPAYSYLSKVLIPVCCSFFSNERAVASVNFEAPGPEHKHGTSMNIKDRKAAYRRFSLFCVAYAAVQADPCLGGSA